MQTGLICFEVMVRVNKSDVDLKTIARELGLGAQELKPQELLRLAGRCGFKAKVKKSDAKLLAKKYPLPLILIREDSYVVLLKIDAEKNKAIVFDPKSMDFKPGQTGANVTEVDLDPLLASAVGGSIVMSPKMISDDARFGFGWFYTEIMRYGNIIREVLMASFVVQLFGLITPLFTQVILDKVIVHRTLTTLDVLAVAFVGTTLFEFLLNLARNHIFIHTTSKLDAKLGAKLFRHLFALPFVYFESRQVGNIAARVRELDNIREFITSKSVSVIIDLVFSTVFVVMMLMYSIQLTMVVFACVALVAILYVVVTPTLRKRLEQKFQMASNSNSYLVESITGIQTVKSLAIEGAMQRKWEDALANYIKSSFKLANLGTKANAISNFCQRIMTIAILYLGVRLVIENKMTIGQLIAFQMFANQFTNPVLRLVNLWNEFQQALLSVDRIGDILNHPVEITSNKAITLPNLQGGIKFDNVSFRYSPSGNNVLENFTLDVKPGTSIGLVGRSGSGKSTIAKLIQRLYLISEGAIYVDGIDIRHMNPVWLRQNIGVVLQENYLFSGSIRENISMPRPDSPIEHIIEVAKIAGAHEFISQLPQGYDTFVGERGSSLSGGQKQRIAIARALITNPRILIFDEATSALDYESERIIQENLAKIKKGRTLFVIAHRLSTVKDSDIIVALDKGKIIESGSHDNLVGQRGYYFSLLQQQDMLNKGVGTNMVTQGQGNIVS